MKKRFIKKSLCLDRSMLRFPVQIFDFDGTLCDTAEDILTQLNLAFLKNGLHARALAPAIIGPSLDVIIESLFPCLASELKAQIMADFRRSYSACGFTGTRIYGGIQNLLKNLHAHGVKAYIATNKPLSQTVAILERHKLRHYFNGVFCPDSFPDCLLRKDEMLAKILALEAVAPSAALMIGDSTGDIEAAKKNGMLTAAVLYGYGTTLSLLASCPDYVVVDESWREIMPYACAASELMPILTNRFLLEKV